MSVKTDPLWNPDNVKDIAESVGIPDLNDDISKNLALDVEYRLHQVLQEATKFMRHSKRTTLSTSDITHALRVLNVEPLYGYDSTRPLKFGEASLGPAQMVYYVEDDEVDFEKLINAPLPKVPREVTFTTHWLAIDGSQPSIPQNPTIGLTPSGSSGSSAPASTEQASATPAVKPLVKHILSKELQLYFDRICTSLLDSDNPALQSAALSSLRHDPGLHQLLPYFLSFISEKITHSLRSLFVLTQMLELTHALLDNTSLFIDPYVSSLVPPILTCLVGLRLPANSYPLRDFAASLVGLVCRRFADSWHTLRSRLTRTCLKHFLDPAKSVAVHYGGIIGIAAVGGAEAVRVLVVPNLKIYGDGVLKGKGPDEREPVLAGILNVLKLLEADVAGRGADVGEADRERLVERVGEIVAERVWREGRKEMVLGILRTGESAGL